jgi:hypothetical protein
MQSLEPQFLRIGIRLSQAADEGKVGIRVATRSGTEGSSSTSFENILLRAVDLALVSALGMSAATAVKFYVDTSLICQDPLLFEESLNKLFGSSQRGEKLLEERIKKFLVDILATEFSIQVPIEELSRTRGATTFSDFVKACRREYSHRVSS